MFFINIIAFITNSNLSTFRALKSDQNIGYKKTKNMVLNLLFILLLNTDISKKGGDIILTKKILSKNTLPGLFAYSLHSGTRGHSMKLPMQHSMSRYRSHFFSQIVINLWNQLSWETVSTTSTNTFKSHLDKEWLCQEFLYNWEATESSTRV